MSSFLNTENIWKRFMDGFIMEWEEWCVLKHLEFAGRWTEGELAWLKQSLVKAFTDMWSDTRHKSLSAEYPSFRWTLHGPEPRKPMDFVLNLQEERQHGKIITRVSGIRIPDKRLESQVREEWETLPLSKREKQVLGYVASGYTNKEIASALYISEHTADGHRTRIYKKLGVRSFKELVKRLG